MDKPFDEEEAKRNLAKQAEALRQANEHERLEILQVLGYFDKQHHIIKKLENEISPLDLSVWENGYVFAIKTQQLFTALEDLFKQIAKSFENHIEDLGSYNRELLVRMNYDFGIYRP